MSRMRSDSSSQCVICDGPVGVVRRKKICSACHQNVCSRCIPLDPRSKTTRICSVCQLIICSLSTKTELSGIRTQHLVRFVDANKIDRTGCRDKEELVDLIIRTRSSINPNRNSSSQDFSTDSHIPNSTTANSSASVNEGVSVNTDNYLNHIFGGFEQSMSTFANCMTSFASNLTNYLNRPNLTTLFTPFNAHSSYTNIRQQSPNFPLNSVSGFQCVYQSPCQFTFTGASTTSAYFSQPHTAQPQNAAFYNRNSRRCSNRNNSSTAAPSSTAGSRSSNPPSTAKKCEVSRVRASIANLKSVEDIAKLSTRDMKDILEENLIATKGCIEKSDLASKVQTLLLDVIKNRKEKEKAEESDSNSSNMCKICMDEIMDCAFVECGHMVACLQCGKKLTLCPMCREPINRVIKIFRSTRSNTNFNGRRPPAAGARETPRYNPSGGSNDRRSNNARPMFNENYFTNVLDSFSTLANGMTSLAANLGNFLNVSNLSSLLSQIASNAFDIHGSSGPSNTRSSRSDYAAGPSFTQQQSQTRNRGNFQRSRRNTFSRTNARNGEFHTNTSGNTTGETHTSEEIKRMSLSNLTCEDDVEKLSTRDMKNILKENFVSTHGCIEKCDLASKVKTLLKDMNKHKKEKEQLDENDCDNSNLCKICMDNIMDCAFVECGHMIACLNCGKKLSSCPICREPIIRIIKIFRS